MLHEFIGCGTLLVVYPYIKTPGRSLKWAYLALATATIVYLVFFIYSFMYFNHGQMKEHLWPTLSLISIIEMPLIQRMEYLVLSFWLLKVLSIITLGLWAACHCLKLERSIKPSLGLKLAIVLFAVLLFVVKDTVDIDMVTELYTRTGEILILLYVPLLFIISLVRKNMGDSAGPQDTSDQAKGEET